MEITKDTPQEITNWIDYFEKRLLDVKFSMNKTISKPCLNAQDKKPDCAVITKFYKEYADGLLLIKNYKPKLYKESIKQWYCHNYPNKICKGLLVYLNEEV